MEEFDINEVDPGDMILLSDARSIMDAKEFGETNDGIVFKAEEIKTLVDADEYVTYKVVKLGHEHLNLYLVAKIVDQHVDYKVMFLAAEDFEGWSRIDYLENEVTFMFDEDSMEDADDAEEIQYASVISNEDEELDYQLKPQGELQGSITQEPKISGIPSEGVSTIAEYVTSDDTEFDELLIFEESYIEDADGIITFLKGNAISEYDIKLYDVV